MSTARRRAAARPPVVERTVDVDGTALRTLEVRPAWGPPTAGPHVVVVPGMGALGYLVPLLRALAERGARATLLDVPGFGTSGPAACAPSVTGIGRLTAAFLARRPDGPDADRPVVLLGHSTGAQGALHAALHADGGEPAGPDGAGAPGRPARLVLAGPTVAPRQRTLPRLLLRAPAAYRRDSPRELVVVPDYVRGGRRAVTLLRSAVDDRPEDAVALLRLPVTVTAGRYDTFAPMPWLERLAASARLSPDVRLDVLEGSHNNPFTHPAALADVAVR